MQHFKNLAEARRDRRYRRYHRLSGLVTVFFVGMTIGALARDAHAAEILSTRDARVATRIDARLAFAAFTETDLRVGTRCWRVTRSNVRCRVHVVGDRIDARYGTSIRPAGRDRLAVYAGRLEVSR